MNGRVTRPSTLHRFFHHRLLHHVVVMMIFDRLHGLHGVMVMMMVVMVHHRRRRHRGVGLRSIRGLSVVGKRESRGEHERRAEADGRKNLDL